jgi:uncharacterized protein YwqG
MRIPDIVDVPGELQPHWPAIRASYRPLLGVVRNSEHPPADPTGSQLGGRAWWPKSRPYPLDRNGKPLFLLVQINFAEAPVLDPFPRSGLLQFFIGTNDLYGCNLDDPLNSDSFHCEFHAVLDEPRDPIVGPQSVDQKDDLPLQMPLQGRELTFEIGAMPVDPSDYRFHRVLPFTSGDDDLRDAYYEFFDSFAFPRIRLGGYPTFTQTDPREYRSDHAIGDFTLLTIDSTDGVMWGDSGAGQFLVHETDVARRDFTRIAYNWDCH